MATPELDNISSAFELTSYSIELANLRLREPMQLPFGVIESRPSCLVRIEGITDRGMIVGKGEATTLPQALFTDDSGKNIHENTRVILEQVRAIGRTTFSEVFECIRAYQFQDTGSYPTARLGAEMAIVDALAKTGNVSVKTLIGIPEEVIDVPYGKSIGAGTEDQVIEQVNAALSTQATKIKLKISPETFGQIYSSLKKLLEQYPDIYFMVDANGMFDPTDVTHLSMIESLDKLGLMMIEEPVSRLGTYRSIAAVQELRRRLPELSTPICLDDCLKTEEDCYKVINEGLAQIINIKPGRIGSFLKSISLIDWAKDHGGQVMIGGMLEATIGRRMTSILGAYCLYRGFAIPGDLSLAQERLAEDVVQSTEQMRMNEKGNIVLPSGLGWGK